MQNNIQDYVENGFRIFPLWSFDEHGCHCPMDKCNQAGKHPAITSWTQVPHWSEEQLENMLEHTITTGFGVVVEKHLIVDIDPRNGGDDSFRRFCSDWQLPLEKMCGFTVYTGGGGSHLYFRLPDGDNSSYMQSLPNYKGIDFKTSGYVVGAGSKHASGKVYYTDDFLGEITEAPAAVLEKIRKPDTYRASFQGISIDMADADIVNMLGHVSPDCDYEQWIRIGMAIHEATSGGGFDLWDTWSGSGDKYPSAEVLQHHWQSFGKSSNPVTIGTLIHYAEQGGYQQPVTYSAPEIPHVDEPAPTGDYPFDISGVDLLRPPGLVGQLVDFINGNCRYPRERLAVAAALTSLSNICGMRYTDAKDGITMNLIALCVAGSATGKEAVLQSTIAIHSAIGIQKAVVGNIKSEQEMVRNLIRHQANYYIIDEIGYLLQKIEKARKSGGSSYLDSIIATIMAVFSKADGTFLVGGDIKDEIIKELKQEFTKCRNKVENMEDDTGYYKARMEYIEQTALKEIDSGLRNPFLSLLGMTTPVSFDGIVSDEQATNGFIGRCFLVREAETNPRRKKNFRKRGYTLPDDLRQTLQNLFDGGDYDQTRTRVEYLGDRVYLPTTAKATQMMEDAADWLEEQAEYHKGATGLEAIIRRAYELMAKISLILAVGGGLRTEEHVRWAFALMVNDIEEKIRLATTNRHVGGDVAMEGRIIDAIGDGETKSVILQRASRAQGFTKEQAERVLGGLLSAGKVRVEKVVSSKGREVERYVKGAL